jgi:hypothetical protein
MYCSYRAFSYMGMSFLKSRWIHIKWFCLSLIVVLVQAEITGSIPYQSSCNSSVNNSNCSSNRYCKCATVPTGENICTQQMSCEYSTLCGPNNECDKPNSTCVIEDRCNGTRICYSIVLFSPELCPQFDTTASDNPEN